MTDKDFEEITNNLPLNFDWDWIHDPSEKYFRETTYIEKLQQKYIETHEKIDENDFDILTSVRRGEYKEIFDSYINYCLEKEKKPEVKHLFSIYNEIKMYFTTNIGLDAFTNICEGELSQKEFFNDFEDLPPKEFLLIIDNWKKYGNTRVKITYSKLFDILKDFEYATEKEINKIDILFLEYAELIEKQNSATKKGKKKALDDDDFEDYKNEYFTPQVIKDLIEGGQLERNMTNGKYRPFLKIKDFIIWMGNNGYEDCLNYNFINRYIFHKNTENTINQYLKPCNSGREKQKKAKRKPESNIL